MTFQQILGQNKAVSLLDRALASGRLAHSYLFSGPQGVGKTTVALAMTAQIFCPDPLQDGSPCGECAACVKLRSGSHPDFLRIRPDGAAIKIDQIRSLKQAVQYPPLEAPYRITLLEAVQTMRREAANSLLKLLEEPPPDNLLLLELDGAAELLPATIVSRCQAIPFAPLPMALTGEALRRHLPESDEAHIQELATLSDGCPGQALDGSLDDILPIYKQVTQHMLERDANQAARVEAALATAGQLPENDEKMGRLLHLLRLFLKNSLVERLAPAPDCPPEIVRAREIWNPWEISAKMQAVDLMEQALARNCNRSLSAEVLLLSLFDRILSPL